MASNTNLIDLLKKAPKNDGYRPAEQPEKYYNNIARLNSKGANQYAKAGKPGLSMDAKAATNDGTEVLPK